MYKCTDNAYMVAVSVGNEYVYFTYVRKIKVSEFRESTLRKINNDHVMVLYEVCTGVGVCKSRAVSEKFKHGNISLFDEFIKNAMPKSLGKAF